MEKLKKTVDNSFAISDKRGGVYPATGDDDYDDDSFALTCKKSVKPISNYMSKGYKAHSSSWGTAEKSSTLPA